MHSIIILNMYLGKVTALSKYANKEIAKELKLRKYYRKCNQENFMLSWYRYPIPKDNTNETILY